MITDNCFDWHTQVYTFFLSQHTCIKSHWKLSRITPSIQMVGNTDVHEWLDCIFFHYDTKFSLYPWIKFLSLIKCCPLLSLLISSFMWYTVFNTSIKITLNISQIVQFFLTRTTASLSYVLLMANCHPKKDQNSAFMFLLTKFFFLRFLLMILNKLFSLLFESHIT